MKKQVQVFYSGSVQGVGFRYTVDRLSQHFEVTGYVKNLSNGKVELLAEGEEAVLQDFLQAVNESAMQSYIRDAEVKWQDAISGYKAFGVAL